MLGFGGCCGTTWIVIMTMWSHERRAGHVVYCFLVQKFRLQLDIVFPVFTSGFGNVFFTENSEEGTCIYK